MRTVASILFAAAVVLAVANARAQEVCVGDCNGNGMVQINELVVGVNIALGSAQVSACPSFACQGGDTVPINCLIQGVNNALGGCGPKTPSPTPTATPSSGTTKERSYVIAPGTLLADPAMTATGLFTTGLSCGNASTAFCNKLAPDAASCDVPAELTLVLGAPDANGVASLTLKNDAILELGIVDGSRFCLQFLAAGSSGSIDCDGGTAYDINAERPSLAPGVDFTFQTGLGDPAGPGNGNLILPARFKIVPSGDTTACDAIVNPEEVTFAFTTTKGVASISGTNPLLSLEVWAAGNVCNQATSGAAAPFSCDDFATPGSGGMLTAPLPANQAPIGDVANALRIAEQPPQ